MAETLSEAEVEELEVEEPSSKQVWSSSTIHPVASVFQLISKMGRLLVIRNFVGRMDVDAQLAEMEKKLWDYLQAN